MRNFIIIFFLFISLTGCGSGGGGSSSAPTPPVYVPPVIQNPLNGIWTFANGVQIDTNPDPANPGKQLCERLDLSIWKFPTNVNYTLTKPFSSIDCQFVFGSVPLDSGIGRCTVMMVGYPQANTNPPTEGGAWGTGDLYYLVKGLDGGIYTMKFVGGGYGAGNKFEVLTISDSPQIFLPPTLNMNTVWVGGMLGKSTMLTENIFTTSPGMIDGCYKFRETFTELVSGSNYSIALNWWYLPGSGFVDRYNVDTHVLLSRTPMHNG